MDEIIIRLARAIASRPRLRILSCLAQHDETTPTALTQKLHLPLNALSGHLRLLMAVGLIRGRRSGARCHYAFRSAYGEQTLSGAMSRWLNRLLRTSEGAQVGPSRNRPALHTVVFEAATAFTDLRRLQILRHLDRHVEATAEECISQLGMSAPAVSRHMAKLSRRGFVVAEHKGRGVWAFRAASKPKSAVHGSMREIVRRAWQKR
ncbi:MAG: helix-turn-helix domain-containing protein [Verrucomicrobia bacterium]|nr:helix-turn-helix domain-containing protein [Verrucomicrobiota bacterium]